MKAVWKITWLSSGLASLMLASQGCGRAEAAPKEAATRAPVSGTDLTVYKEDFAMVHESRALELKAGANQIRIDNVSKQLDPNTVSFQPPKGTEVVATTYDLGVGAGSDLIQRLAGKPVELIWASDNGKEGDRLKGILEPNAGGGFLIRSGDKIYVNPAGTLVATADPDVATQPGLAVQLSSDGNKNADVSMSYLTRGMSWSADYVAHLNSGESTMDLECWASVTNGTGIPYRNANVTFVAGSPSRAVRAQPEADYARAAESQTQGMRFEAKPAAPMTPQAVGELYEYKSTGPATIGVDQMSRVRMMQTKTVPVHFDYSVRLPEVSPWYAPPAQNRIGAQLAVKFKNGAKEGLGMPLPGGGIRFFESDGANERYTGADTMGDTPQDAPVDLTVSKVFDVFASTEPVKTQRLNKHLVRQTIRVTLHNSKKEPVLVRVVQGISDGAVWKFIAGTRPEAPTNSLRQWRISVPAHGQQVMEASFEVKV